MIVGALLARNEAAPDRYLRRVLSNMASLCDAIVVLDDGSTDGTPDTCREFSVATVHPLRDTSGWWGVDETGPRARLWELACRAAGLEGWVYVADADHELISITRDDMQVLARAQVVTGWGWPLLDCWESDTLHRTDGWWQAWRSPRPWMAKVPPADFIPDWRTPRGIHTGHFPPNLPLVVAQAPGVLRHLGYINAEHRRAKAERYLALAG